MGKWIPITGVPEPPWGITQEVTDFLGQEYDYIGDGGLQPYREGPNGPYTHFINPTDPNATDEDNPYGTVAKPRMTDPGMRFPVPGSVYEFHNSILRGMRFEGIGTFDKPVYVRGFNTEVEITWDLECDYHIFEGFKHDRRGVNSEFIKIGARSPLLERQYIALRNCEYTNIDPDAVNGRVGVFGTRTEAGASSIHHLVVTNCHFHHSGHLNTGDRDVQGIAFIGYVHDIWIVDNHFHDLGGDGVQLNADLTHESLDMPTRVYIGRNVFHDNYENSVDLKMCQDVIISRNTAYNFGLEYATNAKANDANIRVGSGSGAPALWRRTNIWILFNELYNSSCEDGVITFWVQSELKSDQLYVIGNIIHDCHITTGKSATGIGVWESLGVHVMDNTLYNLDRGCNITLRAGDADSQCWFHNNIFGALQADNTGHLHNHVQLHGAGGSFGQFHGNNSCVFEDGGEARIRWDNGGGWVTSSFESFQLLHPDTMPDSIEADPKHRNADGGDFALRSDSPCINAGLIPDVYQAFEDRYGLSIREDFDGNPIPSGPTYDIGAHEYETAAVDYRIFKTRMIR